jgi:D-serine ammonia-lyase
MAIDEYPVLSKEALHQEYHGTSIHQLPTPAAIIDISKVKRNCTDMLEAVAKAAVSFRAHVKTHKTLEITKLQVGEQCRDVRVVVSTVMEAEKLVPLMKEYQSRQAKVNILYGVPLGQSQGIRLAHVAMSLGEGSVSVMIDHVAQLETLKGFQEMAGFPALVFLKTDSGYHRAGVAPDSQEMMELVKQVGIAEEQGIVKLLGFYSHNSLSYGGNSPDDAMDMLKVEIDVCRQASQHFKGDRQLIVSVGASPTALSLQNVTASEASNTSSAQALKDSLQITKSRLELEIHAGVYPLFDMQQVAASSRHFKSNPHDQIAVSILAEVCSLYPNRTEKPEALIAAGALALAREPCKDYPGWGVVSPWNLPESYSIAEDQRIIVSRISQEHGILAYEGVGSDSRELPLTYGQSLRIWPNHACITLAMFGFYFVIDSTSPHPESVIDVFTRWRGW